MKVYKLTDDNNRTYNNTLWGENVTRYICKECSKRVRQDQILTAPNPFDSRQRIEGCPNCYSIDRLAQVCDEPGCWKEATWGAPSGSGYRRTCYEHRDQDVE